MNSEEEDKKFLCDRMVGSLCKYLRFMGYDTTSANDLPSGNPREDTILLQIAEKEDRIILTQDAELARRGNNKAIRLISSDISGQICELYSADLIIPELRLTRCSRCNSLLVEGKTEENSNNMAPSGITLAYCPVCLRQYWEGSHTRNLQKMLDKLKDQF